MVSKFVQPDFTSMDPATYKAAIDNAIAILSSVGNQFNVSSNYISSLNILIGAGALFNKDTSSYLSIAEQVSPTVSLPSNPNYRVIRFYIDCATGFANYVSSSDSTTPTDPNYPSNCLPLAKVTLSSTTSVITDSMIIDERTLFTGSSTPKNTYLFTTSTTFLIPTNTKYLRITMAGGGGGGGGGSSSAADATRHGAGGGGGGASIINRIYGCINSSINPYNLSIIIGAGGAGGTSASTTAVAGAAGVAGGITSVIGYTTLSCNGGSGGAAGTGSAHGSGGAGGVIGTADVAGTSGGAGVANTGGISGGTGVGGIMSPLNLGANTLNNKRSGTNGSRGSGGSGAAGYSLSGTDAGGSGGNGFVLIEVF